MQKCVNSKKTHSQVYLDPEVGRYVVGDIRHLTVVTSSAMSMLASLLAQPSQRKDGDMKT